MTCKSLKLKYWPAADRELWYMLTAKGSLLRRGGRFADHRPASLRALTFSYGHWLATCQRCGLDLDEGHPGERITFEWIEAWNNGMANLAWKTRCNRFRDLQSVLRDVGRPEGLQYLGDLAREAEWHALREGRRNKVGKVLHTGTLYRAGLDYMTSVAGSDLASAIRYRDGLILASLALLTFRNSNFRDLEIGRSFLIRPGGFDIVLEGDVTKNGRVLEKAVPEQLTAFFTVYLKRFRLILMSSADHPHQKLWVTARGTWFTHSNLGSRITTLTKRIFGIAVSPHLFRDAAATTVAREAPSRTLAVAGILGHASLATANRYYNQARCLDGSRTYTELIETLAEPAINADARMKRMKGSGT